MKAGLYAPRSPFVTARKLPPIPSPTTNCPCWSCRSGLSDQHVPRRRQPPVNRGILVKGPQRLGLRPSLGGSPRQPAESSLRKLRTGSSPGVALHLPSRGRSYLRLPGSRRARTGTCTLRVRCTCRGQIAGSCRRSSWQTLAAPLQHSRPTGGSRVLQMKLISCAGPTVRPGVAGEFGGSGSALTAWAGPNNRSSA